MRHTNPDLKIRKEKRCPRCKTVKSVFEFYATVGYDGRNSYCKNCSKAYYRERYAANPLKIRARDIYRDYGMTLDEASALTKNQGNRCAICECLPTDHRLCIDHDHKTNEVRGLLCRKCNLALGLLKDSPELFDRAFKYLTKGKLCAEPITSIVA